MADDVPRHPGHQDVTAYFPRGEKAVTDLLEGQLAFLSHVRLYEENHPGTHILPAEPRLEVRVPPLFPRMSR